MADRNRLEWPTYMNLLRQEMWDSVKSAREASKRWRMRDAALRDEYPDHATYRTRKKADQVCADELNTYDWHRGHAEFLATVIATEIEVRRWNHGAVGPDNKIPVGA